MLSTLVLCRCRDPDSLGPRPAVDGAEAEVMAARGQSVVLTFLNVVALWLVCLLLWGGGVCCVVVVGCGVVVVFLGGEVFVLFLFF